VLGFYVLVDLKKRQRTMIKWLVMIILVEALVELLYKAAPLQGIRNWVIKVTPFLRSEEQGHLLECKYCTAVWVGFVVVLVGTYLDYELVRVFALMIVLGRLSNYVHIVYSTIRDKQLNMRLSR
jgi:hypothetical protein